MIEKVRDSVSRMTEAVVPPSLDLIFSQHSSVAAIGAECWQTFEHNLNPFLSYAFLHHLEQCGAVSDATGWSPKHILISQRERNVKEKQTEIIGLLPLYEKHHSWGEYVFDQAWANGYAQTGLHYYPKLLTSIPFTPVVGPRLLLNNKTSAAVVIPALLEYLINEVDAQAASSWHLLFPDTELSESLINDSRLLPRLTCQFHWFNRSYASFDDYLSAMKSKGRKMIRRERRKIAEEGISFRTIHGVDITEAEWHYFYRFYAATYLKRQQRPYLPLEFFLSIGKDLSDVIFLEMAYLGAEPIASALFFRSSDTLYGRYWGTTHHVDTLHFETCYYRGIEHCIQRGLMHFDVGVQGEHKLLRGFEPLVTPSFHYVGETQLKGPIQQFVALEYSEVKAYAAEAELRLPYKSPEAS